ncbi:MAG: T9SS type A sorting domain-containing protein [Bacteroidetes bacterium]|nr:T9SS type A sorting domain-containing protein [Bacteroidota bacterium]
MKFSLLSLLLVSCLALGGELENVVTKSCASCHNSEANISFTLSQTTKVKVVVYNLIGQKVKMLANHTLKAGVHTIQWNGDNETGEKAANGVYLYKVETEKNSITQKMTLVK